MEVAVGAPLASSDEGLVLLSGRTGERLRTVRGLDLLRPRDLPAHGLGESLATAGGALFVGV